MLTPQMIKHLIFRSSFALFSSLLCVGASVYCSACGGTYSRPTDFDSNPTRLHRVLKDRSLQVKSLSGELAVELWEKSERVRFRQMFATRPPQYLRLDTLSPFEQPIATLVSDGEHIFLFKMDQRRFYKGKATIDHFERLSKLRLPPKSLTALLSGQIPLLNTQGGEVTWDKEHGWYGLTLIKGEERQVVFFEPKHLTPVDMSLYQSNQLMLKVRLGEYTSKEPRLPQRLRLQIPSRDVRVEVRLKEFTMNPNLPQEAFQLSPPVGLTVEEL